MNERKEEQETRLGRRAYKKVPEYLLTTKDLCFLTLPKARPGSKKHSRQSSHVFSVFV